MHHLRTLTKKLAVCVAMCQIRTECCCRARDVKLLHPTEAMGRKLESLHAIAYADAFLLKHIHILQYVLRFMEQVWVLAQQIIIVG